MTHRCRAERHCVAKTQDGAALTIKARTICQACVKRLQLQLEQLPHFRRVLRSFLETPLTVEHGSKVSATQEHSAPVNLVALDLLDEIDDALRRAAGARVGDLITRPPERFVVWCSGKRRQMYLPGVDRALAIGDVWRKADSLIGLSRTWLRRPAPCPRCGESTLGMWGGEETVHCTSSACSTSFSLSEYERFCIAKAELERLERKEEK